MLLFADGFDDYSVAAERWTETGGATINAANARRTPGQGLSVSQSSYHATWNCGPAGTGKPTLIYGMAVAYGASGGGNNGGMFSRPVFSFMDGSSTVYQCQLRTDSTGRLFVCRGNNLVQQGPSTAVPIFTAAFGIWHYLELKVSFTAGSFELRVDGSPILTGSGLNLISTANASATGIRLGGEWWSYDDVYLCDTSGARNNDFIGDVKVVQLPPVSAGTYQEWTPSSGTSHPVLVDEAVPNDTDYLSSAVIGARETQAHAALSLVGTVKAVIPTVRMRKDDAGSRQAAPLLILQGTEMERPAVALSDSYISYREILELNPATGAPWQPSDLAGAPQLGAKVVA